MICKLPLAVIGVMLLSSCSNIMGKPEVVTSSSKSITVMYEPILYTDEAMALVEWHCDKQGLSAVRTMTNNAPMKTETFECK